jgi:hypothetical protein
VSLIILPRFPIYVNLKFEYYETQMVVVTHFYRCQNSFDHRQSKSLSYRQIIDDYLYLFVVSSLKGCTYFRWEAESHQLAVT